MAWFNLTVAPTISSSIVAIDIEVGKESVAKSLIDHVKAEGSSDNMTGIVVFFDTFELKEPPQAVSESAGI